MSGSDLNQCLELKKIASVLSLFNLSMCFVSHVRAYLMESFKRATVSTRSAGSLFMNETVACHQDRSARLIL